MWSNEAHQLALLEFWASGTLKRRKSQAAAWEELAELPWSRRSARHRELALDEASRPALETMLDRVFPTWREVEAELRRRGLKVDLHGYRSLGEKRRVEALPEMRHRRLNQRTANAVLGVHSKATLSEEQREAIDEVEVTRDGLVRIRPNAGLSVIRNTAELDANALAECLGELVLTERALLDGTQLRGVLPKALLTVENLGTFVDIQVPPGWMVAFVPGWNTATARYLLELLSTTPVVHFGDLDHDGFGIMKHLRSLRPDLIWALPPFWQEQVAHRGQMKGWPADLDLGDAPEWVQRLASDGVWLEQEVLVLDQRLAVYLDGLLEE
ncbi:Wadjet anti-phage system protein JetD domain-containing protein [Bradymonas sediminis]|uniref:Uncharacterized protein n=1 Tax=Bradymonas sediminis TaxID=1548548 RepID=A0A2Z4FK71_9DELT|nr:Wadjet anti-phage system protein JetD domain-containing protein [Bradymonas sediminis]AWV89343.1 hypothetical protein DN745_08335 [Bradymonas sediminis]TDP73520.1 uncharacterized protein DUF2220 [Bradymonas sediminis]